MVPLSQPRTLEISEIPNLLAEYTGLVYARLDRYDWTLNMSDSLVTIYDFELRTPVQELADTANEKYITYLESLGMDYSAIMSEWQKIEPVLNASPTSFLTPTQRLRIAAVFENIRQPLIARKVRLVDYYLDRLTEVASLNGEGEEWPGQHDYMKDCTRSEISRFAQSGLFTYEEVGTTWHKLYINMLTRYKNLFREQRKKRKEFLDEKVWFGLIQLYAC
jgi:hypothetical protein